MNNRATTEGSLQASNRLELGLILWEFLWEFLCYYYLLLYYITLHYITLQYIIIQNLLGPKFP